MRIDKKVILSWSAVIFWMILIFAFSAQPAVESEKVSMSATSIIFRIIEFITGINADLTSTVDHIVRKSAHAFVFFVLAMLVVNALFKTGVKGFRVFIFAFIITLSYACTDEIHQMFVPGRACRLSDVGIDSLGAVFGLCLIGTANWLSRYIGADFTVIYKLNVLRRPRTNNE